MAYNESTTIGEIFYLTDKVLKENDVFKIGKRKLAKIFLCELLELNTSTSDKEIESNYKIHSPRKETPADHEGFWSFVEKTYLHLEVEPKSKFTELSLRVNEDLIAVSENIAHIKKELTLLEEKKNKNGRLTADDRYYRNQLEYFEKKNLVAKNEIVEFMTSGIKKHAISKASVRRSFAATFENSFLGDSPYAFGRRSHWVPVDPYDVNSLDVYSNKFMDLPISTYIELIKECKSSPETFKKYASTYIAGIPDELPSIREKLSELVDKSHILFSRKKTIETMLSHFEKKDYISFVSMAPLQIEGIFADICREIGVSESQLDISSLNDKLQHIEERTRSFFSFEYYSFKFPTLRNLVAHGGLVDGDLEDTAIYLMLDLLPVCELTISKDLPIIRALEVLREASNGKNKELLEWIDLRNTVIIPAFYAAENTITKAEAHYTSKSFWDYLEDKLKKLKDMNQVKSSESVIVAGKLKRIGIATDQAEKFLKSSRRIAAEAIKKRNETLEILNNHFKP
ncbi:hypothetical protein ABHN98_09355 [Pseudomonas syringae]